MTEDMIRTAEARLAQIDPLLGGVIKNQHLVISEPRGDYFASLARSIIGQQVSVAAARAIALRLQEQTDMKPANTVTLTDEQIKAIGLSKQKAGYIRDLAQHFVDDPEVYDHLDSLSDEEVITELTAVKGIGTWTAQMFLMFTLSRPDVFAPDDGGLQRAVMQLYKWDTLPPKKELAAFAEKWQPYRTVASLHLWQLLDAKPTT